jgi:hypothetical protein
MSVLYAFINQEYYKAWCDKYNHESTMATKLEYLKEFGTPILQYIDPQDESYIRLEKGHCVYLNFNYYTELRRRFPNISIKDPYEQEYEAGSFVRSIKTFVMNTLNKTGFRRFLPSNTA